MKHASYDLEDFTFIADSSLIAGSFNGLRFSSQGNLVEITKAIKDAITASSISEYYTIYFKGTSIVIEDFAIGNDRDGMSFGIYTQNASQFIEVVSGYDRDMSTLVPSIPVGVSTDFTEWVNYQSAGGSMEGAVKIVSSQEIGKLQKGDFVKKRNSNKFIEVIDIQPNLLDDTTYRVVLKEAVETSRDEVMQTYVKFKTQFGKFAAYDFMDFDFDFYSTDNSNSGELALEEYNSIDATSYFINLTPVLEEEKVEEGIENDVITSEYDRLSENEMKEFAIRSRMVPSIMKFAMKNATNARNLPYILNVSEVFGSNNISPDIDLENGRNVDNLNMEHFHLNQIPEEPYIDIKGLTSYTDLDGMGVSIDQLKSTDVDYFSLYFNFNGAENTATGLWEDSAFKQLYTKFSNGSQILEPSTVFRGLKYLYKKRKEFNQTAPTEFIDSTEANDYKFGVTLNYVVSTDPEDPNSVTYEVVKNDKFKFICVVLTLKVTKNDNYYINRLKLYELNDITISGVPVDTTIPFQIDLNHPDTDWNLPEISVFASDFSQIDGTAAFTEHITADEFDKLSWVYFNTPRGRYCFKVERVINTEIGKVLRYRKDGGYFTLLRRINGDYNPLFKTVVSFTDIYNSNKLNYPALGDTEVVSNDRTDVIYNYNNGRGISFSSHKNVSEDYGYMKNLFFHKVNDQNVKNLLKLSQTTDKLPLYPKISEIAIDKKDMNLFKSKYSQDFFTKSLAGGGSNLVHGTLSPVEVKAFFASTIMKVKDNYDITAYSPKQENDLDSLDYIRVNKLNTNSVHWFENDTEIVADFYLPQSVKDELLEDGILSKFAKYVEPQNSYRDKTTIEDDLSVYIYQNVVPRFIIDSIEIYALEGKNLSTEFVSTTDVTGLTANGYRIQTNYEVETYQNDSLSFRLIYKKRLGYNYSLKVLVKIEA
jgi:hypothetical protein